MDYPTLLLALSFVWTCIHYLIKHRATQNLAPVTLPRGPRPFPIIGNILELGNKPYRALATLSKTYGPIMTLKLGSITTIVFSSPETAKEVLHKHDQAFSGRRIPDSVQVLNHHKVSMAWLTVSAPWRNLRKVCTIQMFSTRQLDATQSMRRKKVQELLDYVHEHCNSGSALDIGQADCTAVLNSISNTLFSIDLAHHHSPLSQSFKELAWRVMEEVGKPNIADYFPVLRFVDPQGSRRRITRYFERIFTFFDGIVKERLRVRASSLKFKENNDVLDALLCIVDEKNSKFSLTDIKHLLLVLILHQAQ